jgi:hypothetical protein
MTFPALDIARRQIDFARNYTLTLLEDVAPSDWFAQPPNVATHLLGKSDTWRWQSTDWDFFGCGDADRKTRS